MNLKKGLKVRIVTPVILILLIVIVHLTKLNPHIAEQIYARGISRFWTGIFARATSIVPFAIFEVIIIGLLITSVYIIIRIIGYLRTKNIQAIGRIISIIITIALSITFVYSMSASANYYRHDISLGLDVIDPTHDEYIAIVQHFLDDYNLLAQTLERDDDGRVINPYTDKELSKLISEEFRQLDSTYYNTQLSRAKPSIFSYFMSYNSIAGVYFAPTGEVIYNDYMPEFRKPFTIAHELAHSSGVMREDEANLIASYITLNSKNRFIRYSGYQSTFGNLVPSLYFLMEKQDFDDFLKQYDPLITQDSSMNIDFWNSYDSIFDTISYYINNLYLKLQGQSKGVDSYTDSYGAEIIDTGEIDESGKIVVEINYSILQRIYFDNYESS